MIAERKDLHLPLSNGSMFLYLPGAVMLTTMSIAVLEPTMPLWVMGKLGVDKWELGEMAEIGLDNWELDV